MRLPGASDEWLICIIILVIVVSAISTSVYLILRQQNKKNQEQKYDKYLDIAKERYAKGEISQEQYEQIKKDLS